MSPGALNGDLWEEVTRGKNERWKGQPAFLKERGLREAMTRSRLAARNRGRGTQGTYG